MNGKTVQRTLVLTFGPLAAAAGDELRRLLDGASQPAAAVAVLAGDEAAGENEARLGTAVDAVSHAGLRRELARAAWTLDRLDELGVVVIADATTAQPAVGAVLDVVRELARVRLGVGVGVLLLALVPKPGGDRAPLQQLRAQTVFDRGAVVLSRARLDGLRLESEAALAGVAGAAAHALIVTPLRDAPAGALAAHLPEEWDQVLLPRPEEVYDAAGPPAMVTLGVARWVWSPVAARAALAGCWTLAALDAWLAEPVGGPTTLAGQAFGWLEQQGASLGALIAQAAQLLGPPDAPPWHVPPWHAPRPWSMRAAIVRLRPLASAGPISWVAGDGDLSQEVAAWATAAREACRRVLEESPAGGLSRADRWAAALRAGSVELVEQAAARQEREDSVSADLDRKARELGERMDALLDNWPAEEPVAWLPCAWRPWRWPGLVMRYAALNGAGRALRELAEARALLVREQTMTSLVRDAGRGWVAEVERLAGQLEEVGEMLRYVRAGLAAGTDEAGPPALYRHLAADPVEEAARAARASGGLGRQLDALDDSFVESLKAAAWERFDTVEALDAVTVLPFFYPTAEAVGAWWQVMRDDAAPLWPATEAHLAGEPVSTVVFSPNPAALRALLGEGESGDVRWLPGPDRETILVAGLSNVRVQADRDAMLGERGGRYEPESS